MNDNLKKSIWAVLIIAVSLASDALNVLEHAKQFYTQQNTTKEIEIKKLFHYTNMRKTLDNMKDQMMLNIKMNNPKLKDNKEFNQYMNNITSSKKIEELYIKIYSKHYSLNEILQLNKFYSSEEMQKLLKISPQIAIDFGNEMAKLIDNESKNLN